MNKFYRAEMPEFCGYSAIGYGTTPEQAMKACKKAYQSLKNDYSIDSNNPDYGTFKKAWEYFGASLVEQVAGAAAIEGNENYILAEKYLSKRTKNKPVK